MPSAGGGPLEAGHLRPHTPCHVGKANGHWLQFPQPEVDNGSMNHHKQHLVRLMRGAATMGLYRLEGPNRPGMRMIGPDFRTYAFSHHQRDAAGEEAVYAALEAAPLG